MRAGACSLVASLAIALVLAAPAAAAPAPDQRQEAFNSSIAMSVGGSSEQRLAQVITSGLAGYLTQVDLVIGCQPDAVVQLQVVGADPTPSADVLAERAFRGVPGFPLGSPPAFVPFDLGGSLFIPAQTRFAIAIASSGGDCGAVPGPNGDAYGGGNLYFDARPNSRGAWVCQCEFSPQSQPWDLAFRTYVDAACVVPAVRGQTVARAAAALQRYGCALGKVKRARSKKKRGRVIAQSHAPGTALGAGTRVSVVVSTGKKPSRRR